MGSPTPLSPANLRKLIRFVKRKYAERQDANARKRAELAEQALRNEQHTVLEACEASVLRLLDMEQGLKDYHGTEWRRAIDACKRDALRVLRQVGFTMDRNSVQYGPWIGHFDTGSIVVNWRPCKWKLGRVRLAVAWYPNPKFTCGDSQHAVVLSKLLTDTDMDVVGWTYFEAWHTDYGYDESRWILVGSSGT